ncbi:MAG: MFS transporter, partial [Pseudonocardiaceae bacterium]
MQALLFARGVGLGLSIMPASLPTYAHVHPSDLGDSTALMNIWMRIGGAIGGAVCVIVLARALDASPETAFTWAFGGLTTICAAGAIATLALFRVTREPHHAPISIKALPNNLERTAA